ncbi:MAG: hypothetical protein JO250_08105 [Armatimonadetes bacterium]|nr:hypothetical protein [Armatimonadota bacterium]
MAASAGGPPEHNPFRDQAHAAEAGDEKAAHNLTEALTEQDQPNDAGPSADNRNIGEHQGRGRPPLMEK